MPRLHPGLPGEAEGFDLELAADSLLADQRGRGLLGRAGRRLGDFVHVIDRVDGLPAR